MLFKLSERWKVSETYDTSSKDRCPDTREAQQMMLAGKDAQGTHGVQE